MRWASTNTDNRVLMAKTLAKAAEKHQEQLVGNGIAKEQIDEMLRLIELVELQRMEQNHLKSEWHAKTKELNGNIKTLYEYYGLVKKIVKMQFFNPYWKVFGFNDKK